MIRAHLCTALALALLLYPAAAGAQAVPGEPGLAAPLDAPGQDVELWQRLRVRAGLTPMSARAAYNRGFNTGLGWGGIMAAPQLMLWSYPFFNLFAMSLETGHCQGSVCDAYALLAGIGGSGGLALGLMSSGFGLAGGIAGTYLVATNGRGDLLAPRASRAYDGGLVKGMGIILLATGVFNVTLGSLFFGAGGGELFHEDEDVGRGISMVMLGLGVTQVVGGAVMILTGHRRAANALRRVSVAPVLRRRGGALAVMGRF